MVEMIAVANVSLANQNVAKEKETATTMMIVNLAYFVGKTTARDRALINQMTAVQENVRPIRVMI